MKNEDPQITQITKVKLKKPTLELGNDTNSRTNNSGKTTSKKKQPKTTKSPARKVNKTEIKQIKEQPSIKGFITTNKTKTTTTLNKETNPNLQTTPTNAENPEKTTDLEENKPKTTILRTKPPDIDKITPVKLPIKVRGTVVNDMKAFLARKRLERDARQAKLPRPAPVSITVTRGENQTKPSVNKKTEM